MNDFVTNYFVDGDSDDCFYIWNDISYLNLDEYTQIKYERNVFDSFVEFLKHINFDMHISVNWILSEVESDAILDFDLEEGLREYLEEKNEELGVLNGHEII